MNGTGNSKTGQSYSFEDIGVSKGKYFYRLKQIDYNGNYKYYELGNEVIIGAPEKFMLEQNYPNPFNPNTKINFTLSKDAAVTLTVFDISGREVTRLLNNEMKIADYYSIDFNGVNLSSGIYYYRLQAGEFIQTKKMVLLK